MAKGIVEQILDLKKEKKKVMFECGLNLISIQKRNELIDEIDKKIKFLRIRLKNKNEV